MLAGHLAINPHRADEDEALDPGFVHRIDDVARLFLHPSGQIGINAILSRHSGVQRFAVQNIALDHAHTLLMTDLFQALGIPQIKRELCVRLLQKKRVATRAIWP